MRKKNAFINVTASMGRGLLYAYLYIMFRPKICYQSRKAKEEIEKGGVIFIGNHVGHNDGQMFYMLFKNSVLIIAKDWAEVEKYCPEYRTYRKQLKEYELT